MTFARLFRGPAPPRLQAFALALLGLAAAVFTEGHLAWVTGGVVLVLLLPGAVLSRQAPSSAYQTAWKLAVVLAAILATVDLFAENRHPLETALAFLSILVLRAISTWSRPRDNFGLWLLATTMLVLAGMLAARSLALLALAAPWGILSPIVLADLCEDRFPRNPSLREDPPGVRLTPVLLLLTGLLFVFLPRPARDGSVLFEGRRDHSVGAAYEAQAISFSDVTRIQTRPGVALRVEASGPWKPLGDLRLRLRTLSDFRGDHWLPLPAPFDETQPLPPTTVGARNGFVLRRPQGVVPLQSLRVTLTEPSNAFLPLPEGAAALQLEARRLLRHSDASLEISPGDPQVREMVVLVADATSTDAIAENSESASLETVTILHMLLPGSWPRDTLRNLALEAAGGATTPAAQARAMASWFRRRGVYSLDLTALQEEPDPLLAFLTQRMEGHCELYASGMAVLARTLEIPSRIVVGYRGGELDAAHSHLVVRHADAHAWVELWLPETGWTAFDPTPSAPLATGSGGMVFAGLRSGWNKAQAWLLSIFDYDRAAQGRVAKRFTRVARDFVASYDDGLLPRTWGRLRENVLAPRTLWAGLILGLANILAWGIVLSRRRDQRPRRRRPGDAQHRDMPAPLQELLEYLGNAPLHGAAVPRSASARRLIRQSAQAQGIAPEEAAAAARLYERWRFGGQPSALRELRLRVARWSLKGEA